MGDPIAEMVCEQTEKLRRLEWGVAHNAGVRSTRKAPRWAHVKDVTGLGSTSSRELCRRQGVDPDEEVGGVEEAVAACISDALDENKRAFDEIRERQKYEPCDAPGCSGKVPK